MTYKVAIRRNATGEVRFYNNELPWHEHSMFLWTEGNYGCDCNRHLHFAWAAGEKAEDRECGDTEYAVLYAEFPDGTRIPIDED